MNHDRLPPSLWVVERDGEVLAAMPTRELAVGFAQGLRSTHGVRWAKWSSAKYWRRVRRAL